MHLDLDRIARAYRVFAYLIANTLVLLIVINLGLAVAFLVRDRASGQRANVDSRLSSYRSRFADAAAYTRMSDSEITALLDEQDAKGSIGFQYHPWTQFREATFKGRFLNTDSNGFRETRMPKSSSSAPLRVFVFGGSTTFGYGVSDLHTIPSYLQLVLEEKYPQTPLAVSNFGQGFYYSSQEAVLFIRLIKQGRIPDVAVFIDGGNDVSQLAALRDEPVFSPIAKALWSQRDMARPTPSRVPMIRLTAAVRRRLNGSTTTAVPEQHRPIRAEDPDSATSNRRVDFVISTYTHNVRMLDAICREYGIECRFVWQPHIVYKYDPSLHKAFPFDGRPPRFYPMIWATMERTTRPNLLFLGDMFDGERSKIFVDDVHYNETANERIARRIADALPDLRAVTRARALANTP